MQVALDQAAIERFAADLAATVRFSNDARLGLAVSGGPDSLALLRLAHAALPDRVAAATVDHRLRPEAADEAAHVAAICATLGVPHATLTVDKAITGNIQSGAREARYTLLRQWCAERRIGHLATAHHRDDQAETLLMRLLRGSGVGGLAAMRPARPLGREVMLIRPLLGWSRAELAAIAAPLAPVDDPSNHDVQYDRVRLRSALADTEWLDPAVLARSAAALAEADEALDWTTEMLGAMRVAADGGSVDTTGLPPELVRRLLTLTLARFAPGFAPRGEAISRAIVLLTAGRRAMLGDVIIDPGPIWRLSNAPPRRKSAH